MPKKSAISSNAAARFGPNSGVWWRLACIHIEQVGNGQHIRHLTKLALRVQQIIPESKYQISQIQHD
jgi:hypothetical protein